MEAAKISKKRTIIDETISYLQILLEMIERRRIERQEILIYVRQRSIDGRKKITKLGFTKDDYSFW